MTKKSLPIPNPKNPIINEYVRAVKRGLKAQHVVSRPDGWAVKTAGASKDGKIFITQNEAIEQAKKTALSRKSDVFIHGRDGRIRERV